MPLNCSIKLPSYAAYCLAKSKQLRKALETVEQGKARSLAEPLARHEALIKAATEEDQAAFSATKTRIATLEGEARALHEPWGRDFLAVSARQARAELSSMVVRIREYVPAFMPKGLHASSILSINRAKCPNYC